MYISNENYLIASIKDGIQALAVLGAAFFFIYKLATGWLLINLSVSLSAKRRASQMKDVRGNYDDLVVKVILKKGKIDAMRLIDAEIRLTPLSGGKSEVKPVEGIKRLVMKNGIDWNQNDARQPHLNLAPEDSMQFSEHFEVSPGMPYRIDVVVIGDRNWWFGSRKGQWRSSAIVLPLAANETAEVFGSLPIPHASESHSA